MSAKVQLSIDSRLMSRAQGYYEEHGYVDTPTPWLVGRDAYEATCPPEVIEDGKLWRSPLGLYHVASAEQGFIQMILNDDHIPDKAQSTTPCYRWEQTFDDDHLPFFYKLELFDRDTSDAALLSMISLAKQLFLKLGVESNAEPMAGGSYDLTSSGKELGSYGVRHFQGRSWTYGTGLALPRFSMVRDQSSGSD